MVFHETDRILYLLQVALFIVVALLVTTPIPAQCSSAAHFTAPSELCPQNR